MEDYNALFLPAGLLLSTVFTLCVVHLNRGLRPTPFLITAVAFVVLNQIGATLIAVGWTGDVFKDLEKAYGGTLFLHIHGTGFVFLLGAALPCSLAWRPLHFRGEDLPSFRGGFGLGMGLLGVVALGVFAAYLAQLDRVPLFAWSATYEERALLRDIATKQFGATFGRYDLFMSSVLPFVSQVFLVRATERRTLLAWAAWAVFFLGSCIALTATLQKAPIVLYIVLTILIHRRAKGEGVNARMLLRVGIATLILLPLTYILLMGVRDQGILRPLQYGLRRVLVETPYGVLFYLDTFPQHMDFLGGRGLPNPGGLFGHTQVAVARLLSDIYYPGMVARGLHGNQNTLYIMEWYASFGVTGMYGVAFVTGVVVMAASKLASAITLRQLALPLTFFLSWQFVKLAMGEWCLVTTLLMLVFWSGLLVLCLQYRLLAAYDAVPDRA
ncbi:MAG: hypothetical protein NTW87_23950 [Planctomycetota bacterium]|nr:hypothetical protein [Planctomycetota bacterium]